MTTPADKLSDDDATSQLRRELEKAIASGISKRTPEQIRADFRKAREAA